LRPADRAPNRLRIAQWEQLHDGVFRTLGTPPSWHCDLYAACRAPAPRDDRRRNAIIAAGYFPLAARLEGLRSGGQRLVADIRRIARRAAS
jgi:hypothetical protein